MIDAFRSLDPVLQALVAGVFTWFVTALGAGIVVFMRKMSQLLLDIMLGFAAGVMTAAAVWSLLLPSIEVAGQQGLVPWGPAAIGFVAGGVFLRGADALLPHLHPGLPRTQAEGVKTSWQRSTLLVLAITLHNIPEGLAVGVAFGAAGLGVEGASLAGALALAVGIGLQNFPEGIAVALPLRGEGVSRLRSFWYGQLSAAVEPLAAVTGAAFVTLFQPLLPYALAFAAGAMIFVVVEELIPESHQKGNRDAATVGTLAGFLVMMVLDVALG